MPNRNLSLPGSLLLYQVQCFVNAEVAEAQRKTLKTLRLCISV